MPSESLPDVSSEQLQAHKLAAQELVKYCEEFSRWRKTKRGSAAFERSLRARDTLGGPPMKKPDPSAPHSTG